MGNSGADAKGYLASSLARWAKEDAEAADEVTEQTSDAQCRKRARDVSTLLDMTTAGKTIYRKLIAKKTKERRSPVRRVQRDDRRPKTLE